MGQTLMTQPAGDTDETNQRVYTEPFAPPSFKGGEKGLQAFLRTKIQYPQSAIQQKIQGICVIRFLITEDGSVKHTYVLKSLDKACDEVAQQAVEQIPPFIQGKYEGKRMRAWFNVPVIFSLQEATPQVTFENMKIDLDYPNESVAYPPLFLGGFNALYDYLTKNLRYPKIAKKKKIEGSVHLLYSILEDGSIADVVVERSLHPECDAEAIRLVQEMPAYLPARLYNQNKVRVGNRIAVPFNLK